MAYFRANTDSFNNESAQLYRYSILCNRYSNEILGMNFSFLSDNVQGQVERTIRILGDNLAHSSRCLYSQSLGLESVMLAYQRNEKDLLGDISLIPVGLVANVVHTITAKFKDVVDVFRKSVSSGKVDPYEIDNIVYDDEGRYGGDQGHADSLFLAQRKADLWAIVWQTNPVIAAYYEATGGGMTAFFAQMNKEGCGYTAIANIIIEQYIGREDDFERDFGFPMYYGGDLNYDALITYIYSKYDVPFVGDGTLGIQREIILEDIFSDCGIDAEVSCFQFLSPDEISDKLQNGDRVMINVQNGWYIYSGLDDTGLTGETPYHGGHSMVVTGVTEEGYLILSSWGQQWYFDPNKTDPWNFNPLDFEVGTYYDYEVITFE